MITVRIKHYSSGTWPPDPKDEVLAVFTMADFNAYSRMLFANRVWMDARHGCYAEYK